jgi:hypothetical protein
VINQQKEKKNIGKISLDISKEIQLLSELKLLFSLVLSTTKIF